MRIRFTSDVLDRLEVDAEFDAGLPIAAVSAYRRRMGQIRAALDERALYALKSLCFKKLKGSRSHQRSLRLNDQWRLIVELEESGDGQGKTVVIVGIEDYH